ncbi:MULTISPECIES: copper homeostasis membrane protein CopD [unclassified Sphingomonas]|jgi:putative copper resistance protein D|uniref:copper homeostasis membrane protein CopD n=1 Tax=unclassified Sphingomonas TaxID=196159 RepID=UPI000537CD02|nr:MULTISPECIES: copper homeostasis membrane protein CopD [unclassified Sphingomonas]KHA65680.1 copper resistance protein CopD [Sphingomonas sp. Ant20]
MSDWSLIGVRFALYFAMAALFGLSAFSLYGLRARERSNALALPLWLVGSAILSLLLSIGWLVLMASSMAGTPLWPLDQEAIGGLLTGSAIGAAWKLRMVALVVAAFAAMFAAQRSLWLSGVMLASGIALGTLPWTGHGAMDEAAMGWVHLIADILHLIASGAWVGALLGLLLLVSRPAAEVDAAHLGLTHRALHGFGTVGTIVVATVVVTGLVNAWMLVGIDNVAALATTLYGQLLLAKLALFVLMLGLASLNRFRLTPAFEQSIANADHRGALGALRGSLAAETACVVVILGLVAWLGTLAPPASAM